ncbi:MAG: DUF2202 domain-containing protein [Bacteroidia bacterium]|nr:DUF2202 domain-containing protein [Bacteroidia bacterium]
MKTIIKTIVISSFIAAALVFSSCQKDMNNSKNAQYASVINVSGDGTTAVIAANVQSAFVETAALTKTELVSLLKMKEAEKLAHDVYSVLYQKWGSQVFSNISAAESNHLNAIILLLTNYGAADTSIGEDGLFSDNEVQKLYNELVANATLSIEEAYKTGALIEEMDIKDLTISLSSTTNENVIMVFDNLLKGSRNHLRAFNRQLTTLGVAYTPAYISQTDYNLIVSSSMEKGKQYRMNGQGNGQSKGQKGQGNRGNESCSN